MSERMKWIDYKGQKILIEDYSNMAGEEFVAEIGEAEKELLGCGQKLILTITNFSNATMSNDTKERANVMIQNAKAKGITLFVAAVGVTGIQRIIANAVVKDMHFAKSYDDAKDWLVQQALKAQQPVS